MPNSHALTFSKLVWLTALLSVLLVLACGAKSLENTSPTTPSASISASIPSSDSDGPRVVVSASWTPSEERLARLGENAGLLLIEMPQYVPRFFYSLRVERDAPVGDARRGQKLEIEVPLDARIQVIVRVLGYQHFGWSGRLDAQTRFVRVYSTLAPDTENNNSLGYNVFDLPEESGAIREPPHCSVPKPALFDIVTYPLPGYAGTSLRYPYVGHGLFVDTDGVVWKFEGVDDKSDYRYIRIGRVDADVLFEYRRLIPAATGELVNPFMEKSTSCRFFCVRVHAEPFDRHILGEPFVALDWARRDYSARRNAASEEIVKWMLAVYVDTRPYEN